METVTVTKCQKLKEWNGKPIFQVELSNGAIGESFNVEIPIGTPDNQLTFTPNPPYSDKVKWNRPNTGGGGFAKGGSRGGNESFSASYAKDIVCARIAAGNPYVTTNEIAQEVINIAERIYVWLETKKK